MTWVKMCGLGTAEDVEVAVEIGVDAIGFVTAPGSPRRIAPGRAAELGAGTPVQRFLVTLDATPEALLREADAAEVTGVQPHGRHALVAARAAMSAGLEVLLPVDVAQYPDLSTAREGMIPLCDGPRPGSGQTFDWSRLEGIDRDYVLAGGLHIGNVGDALDLLDPYGVDVSSGIESSPGVKDHEKMRRFMEAVR